MNELEKENYEAIKNLISRLSIIEDIKEYPEILEFLEKDNRFYFLNNIDDYTIIGNILSEFFQIKLTLDIIKLNIDSIFKIKRGDKI
jgi:hypothetical protein